jgi:hypothetical protein
MDRLRDALAVAGHTDEPRCMKRRSTKLSYCAEPATVGNRRVSEMGGHSAAPRRLPDIIVYKGNTLSILL